MSNASSGGKEVANGADATKQEQLVKLFNFYENKGFQDKQQMISLVTWLMPFVFGLLAFCIRSLTSNPSLITIIASIAAVLLSGYVVFIIREFVIHAEENYRRAQDVRAMVSLSTLKDLLFLEEASEECAGIERRTKSKRPWRAEMLEALEIKPSMAIRRELGLKFVGEVFLALLLGSRYIFWVSAVILICSVVSLLLFAIF
jgi:hypothetical protein